MIEKFSKTEKFKILSNAPLSINGAYDLYSAIFQITSRLL